MGGVFQYQQSLLELGQFQRTFLYLKAVTLNVVANASNASNHSTLGVDCQVFKVNQNT